MPSSRSIFPSNVRKRNSRSPKKPERNPGSISKQDLRKERNPRGGDAYSPDSRTAQSPRSPRSLCGFPSSPSGDSYERIKFPSFDVALVDNLIDPVDTNSSNANTQELVVMALDKPPPPPYTDSPGCSRVESLPLDNLQAIFEFLPTRDFRSCLAASKQLANSARTIALYPQYRYDENIQFLAAQSIVAGRAWLERCTGLGRSPIGRVHLRRNSSTDAEVTNMNKDGSS